MERMKADPIIRYRQVFPDGAIAEAVVWSVPQPVPPSRHAIKYRLFYGFPGRRIVGYDNERGKGDHRHCRDTEEPYTFIDIETLMADFVADIERERRGSE